VSGELKGVYGAWCRGLYGYAIDNIFPLLSVCIFGEIATIVLITIYVRYCDDRVYVAKTLAYGLVPIILVTIYFILVESGAVHQSNHSFGLVLGLAVREDQARHPHQVVGCHPRAHVRRHLHQ
jgi:hypothetical protein